MTTILPPLMANEGTPYHKILHWFFSFPGSEITLSELSKAVNVSKTSARKTVTTLEEEGFLQVQSYGKALRITADQRHEYMYSRKIAYNLGMVYEIYQIGLSKIIQEHAGTGKAIILFGSYRKGDDTEESDIDIAVETDEKQELHIETVGTVPQLGYRKKVPVNLHIFHRDKIDINLFSNIANGIVLEGFLEVRK